MYNLPKLTVRSDSPYLERRRETLLQCVLDFGSTDFDSANKVRLTDVGWMKDGVAVEQLQKHQGADDVHPSGPM